MQFTSAYRQLSPAEKDFTDHFVSAIETRAVRLQKRIIEVLEGPIERPRDERAAMLLERPLVRAAITERVRELQDAADLSAYKVLKELSSIAFSNIDDYMDRSSPEFTHIDFSKCTREQMAAVKKIDIEYQSDGMTVKKLKFELHDKVGGLDRFMRHMGLLDPDNPYHAAEIKKREQPAIGFNSTDMQAADAYASFING
jgi:hypothetical protein